MKLKLSMVRSCPSTFTTNGREFIRIANDWWEFDSHSHSYVWAEDQQFCDDLWEADKIQRIIK